MKIFILHISKTIYHDAKTFAIQITSLFKFGQIFQSVWNFGYFFIFLKVKHGFQPFFPYTHTLLYYLTIFTLLILYLEQNFRKSQIPKIPAN